MKERLQKFLAAAGVASRRKAEELITAGRIAVNGVVVRTLGTQVDPVEDHVTLDGREVRAREAGRYLLLYKPPGCVTTLSDPEGRPTAIQYLTGVSERVFPVGRLDWDAEGALLFTTDGELANRLAHPRYGHRRTYLVKVKGDPPVNALERMISGVRLDDGPARALECTIQERADKNTWIRVVVGEGRRHLVKRLCESVGLNVLRLFRPEFGGVTVARLRPGEFRELEAEEVALLRRSAGMTQGDAPARLDASAGFEDLVKTLIEAIPTTIGQEQTAALILQALEGFSEATITSALLSTDGFTWGNFVDIDATAYARYLAANITVVPE